MLDGFPLVDACAKGPVSLFMEENPVPIAFQLSYSALPKPLALTCVSCPRSSNILLNSQGPLNSSL